MAEAQCRHPKTRASCRERTTRSIPAEVWEIHKETIHRLFHQRDPELSLKEIRERMTVEHNFQPSTKQWKIQLARWNLRRNMNLSDAAQILWLIRDAETHHIDRQVLFFDSEKTREDIKNYLKKTTRVKSEEELLQQVIDPHNRPAYITFKDLVPSTAEGSGPHVRQAPVMVALSHNARHQPTQPPTTSVDAHEYVIVSPPSDSRAAPPPTEDIKTSAWAHNMQFQNLADYPHPSVPSSFDFLDQPLEPRETPTLFSNLSSSTGLVDPSGFGFAVDNMTLLNSMMSVTPEVYFPNAYGLSGQPQPTVPTKVIQMLGFVPDSEEAEHPSRTHQFLWRCCEACIYLGQGYAMQGQQSINYAAQIYKEILIHELMESLTVLNNLRALFDTYGQRRITDRIFAIALKTAEARIGVDNPITQSIQFVSTIPEQGPKTGPPAYDILLLKNIHRQFADTVGNLSKLALTAQFHVAWALAETRQLDEAREILMHLQIPCETVFGPCHIQTIGCIATLARVYHATGQGISAERLLRETVIARVEERFSSSHPYLWEAKNRQALFLIKLAKTESDARRKQMYEKNAEEILRQILELRTRELGANNPRTTVTFNALRRLLLRQNRRQEANTLSQWCAYLAAPPDRRVGLVSPDVDVDESERPAWLHRTLEERSEDAGRPAEEKDSVFSWD
ncbi:hypothetical protein DV735_g4491, partial [Chaetothyriales sp. CBS 134920]